MSQYKLVVCEKPSVAQAIAAVLGANLASLCNRLMKPQPDITFFLRRSRRQKHAWRRSPFLKRK